LPEIAQDRISSVRVKFDPYQDCFNSSGASQSEDRNDKQKTGFFDSIGQTETNHHVSRTSALYPEAGLPNIALSNKQPSIRRPHCVGLFQ
jgi:hypothetical protein